MTTEEIRWIVVELRQRADDLQFPLDAATPETMALADLMHMAADALGQTIDPEPIDDAKERG